MSFMPSVVTSSVNVWSVLMLMLSDVRLSDVRLSDVRLSDVRLRGAAPFYLLQFANLC
jgi:hypothetical protein